MDRIVHSATAPISMFAEKIRAMIVRYTQL